VKLIVIASIFLLIGCDSAYKHSNKAENKNTIVLLKFKAQPGKGNEAVSELYRLLEKVEHEPHFVGIKLHIDPKDNTNILLYEEWEDESYYNGEHMNTPHLKEFMTNSTNFLIGPPDITFWKVEREFK
jgi:quinol monooxygenase YgiN